MKKLRILLALTVVLAILAPVGAMAESYNFGFVIGTLNNPFCIYLENTLRALVEADGNTMTSCDANYDQNNQLTQIDDLITTGIDAIFLCPVNFEGVRSGIDNLNAAGVRIINFDTPVAQADQAFVDVIVKNDNRLSGYSVGADVASRYPDGCKIAIIDDAKATSVIERVDGFFEGLGNKDKYTIVSQLSGEGTLDKAMDIADAVLQANPDVNVFFTGNDTMALGVTASIKAAGMQKNRILVYGVDGSPDAKAAIRDGEMSGTGAQSPGTIAEKCYEVALKILKDEPFDRLILTDSWLINAQNVETFGFDNWQ
ncbi:MAG: substrate-binding domain-containing protein [Clostridia bacterium]